MKLLRLVVLTTMIASGGVAVAQDYAFKVLAHRGSNEIKSGGAWEPLKTGATLQEGDEVKLGANSYIGLVHSTGKPVEVKTEGVHTVKELQSKVPTGSSVLHKYTDFILSSHDEGAANRLTATGAVTRTSSPAAPGTIKVFLPENTSVFSNNVLIRWEVKENEGPYEVNVLNFFEEVVKKVETAEGSYLLDLTDPKFANEQQIMVVVNSKANNKVASGKYYIKKMQPAEYDKIASLVRGISSEAGEEGAIGKVLMAACFEQNGLLADAILAYEQAKKLEPGAFDETYEEFMLRNKIK
jgi:hypothetical protein